MRIFIVVILVAVMFSVFSVKVNASTQTKESRPGQVLDGGVDEP